MRRVVSCAAGCWGLWLLLGPVWAADAVVAEPQPTDPAVRGSLVIIGGSERFEQREFWNEIVDLAGGPDARIAVIPAASGDPVRKSGWVIAALNKAGADAFLVPLGWKKLPRHPHDVAQDPEIVAEVRSAAGVFMIGGEQERIVTALRLPDGRPTPLLDAMWDVYRRGGVIAGTSAGAAVMSRIMYRDAESVLNTLLHGVRMGKELDRGLGFLDRDWFVDQHCLVRGRFARTLVAMADQGVPYGIGIDENSAVVIRNSRDLKVIGYKGALIFDLSRAEQDQSLGKFNVKNVRLTYLDRGDRFDLKSLEVQPSPQKLEDEKLDPSAPEFRPSLQRKLFFNDILANTAVADLMGRLMDCAHDEAVGLAFDGDRARRESVDGFEFIFKRDVDSVGWYTEAFGGDDYTVLNIRLDVRPIRIAGPLYSHAD